MTIRNRFQKGDFWLIDSQSEDDRVYQHISLRSLFAVSAAWDSIVLQTVFS